MSTIEQTSLANGVERISLCSGRGNPLTLELLHRLDDTLEAMAAAPPRALVLDADGARIFSGGFPLPVLVDWDRNQITAFFNTFLSVMRRLLTLPCATVCAIEGHAIAGGFILSLATDFRVVQTGEFKLGLSEVDLGVAVPAGAQLLLAERTSLATAAHLSMSGHLMNPQRALDCGYALASSEGALDKAVELAQHFAGKPGDGVGVTKLLHSEALMRRVSAADEAGFARFLDSWFSESAQLGLRAMAARLSKK